MQTCEFLENVSALAGRPTDTPHCLVPTLALSKFTWNCLVLPLKTETPAWRPSADVHRQTRASLGSGREELWFPAVTPRQPLPHPGAGSGWQRSRLWVPTCAVGPSASVLTHGGRAHSTSVGCEVTKLDYFKGVALDVGGCPRLVPYLCSPNSLSWV